MLVLPSSMSTEAFGIVQLEAMSFGKPVVNTDLPTGVPEVAPNDVTGLTVPPRDSEALANAVNTILHEPARYDRYCRSAAQRAGALDGALPRRRARRVSRRDEVARCAREALIVARTRLFIGPRSRMASSFNPCMTFLQVTRRLYSLHMFPCPVPFRQHMQPSTALKDNQV